MESVKSDAEGTVVLPGDVICTAEEYLPGENTVENNGLITALVSGTVHRDEKSLTVSVIPKKVNVKIRNGDVVYGQIVKVEQRFADVRIVGVYRNDLGLVPVSAEGVIRILQPHGRQPDTTGAPFLIGDLVRGKVIRSNHEIEISIYGKRYGVIRSLCSRCRNPLVMKNSVLYCENCERVEMRKVADDYGNVLKFGDV
ncbi:RNA-binding protein [Thermogymnomonas acidicola]|uniref:Exosome complex component Csl4 n=1 Tax=Thermogymnomonas acidicola TaxID=399579 RepID=A0AA37FA10_9ARCH|nr:exosome complex RNA-binding protein Csl4 [Thermogymnomonas acidicola]GGM77816.1 RNA-binding protein [Thermogymnomonas acidicola]